MSADPWLDPNLAGWRSSQARVDRQHAAAVARVKRLDRRAEQIMEQRVAEALAAREAAKGKR